jgi:peptidoglycan/xylan/chitin deacetylase (PgdA/CDA1 family)
MKPATTYLGYISLLSRVQRARLAVYGRVAHRIAFSGRRDGIRFLYFHHVFDDEIRGFERQLDRLARLGEFLSLDEAVGALSSGRRIRGRYYCITFDDGFRNHWSNAVPVLAARDVPAAFFVPVNFVDGPPETATRIGQVSFPPVEMLTWDDCRSMVENGMTVGSHGLDHLDLGRLADPQAEHEIGESKRAMERVLGAPCRHFSAPYGRPENYRRERDPGIAERFGYSSFHTTLRGAMREGDSPFEIRRLHAVAHWDS